MNLKRNKISYVSWMILLLFAAAACSFFGLILAHVSNMNLIFSAILLVTGFFGISFLIYLITGKFVKSDRIQSVPVIQNFSSVLEKLLVIGLLCIGFVVRLFLISSAGEDAAYFEVAKLTEQNSVLLQTVQGSVYFYCLLLRGLYVVVGNHWIAGIWLQIILQLAGSLILYLGLKRLVNRNVALLVMCFMLFTPYCIKQSLNYSPQMLYFCLFSIAFFLIADLICKSSMTEEDYPIIMWIYTVITGMIIGLCCYLDVTGFVLVVPVLCLLMVNRRYYKKRWKLRCLACVISMLVSFFVFFGFDSLLSTTPYTGVVKAWFIVYGTTNFSFDILLNDLTIEIIVLVALACVGCFSFWRRKDADRFTPFVLMTLVIYILVFSGITTENMNGCYLLYVLVAALAAVSMTELFYKEKALVELTEDMESMDMESKSEQNIVELIENPLPLPKKHVHKAMDYAFTPDKSQMKYDIYVADNDDFDIK